MFLGSSLMNGGTGVTNDQTISSFVEDSATEALNFGTMLYALDQTYLAYATDLFRFGASVVVVGLPADPADGLTNRYVPFRARDEVNMPFLKPRFDLKDGMLVRMPPLPRALWEASLRDPSFIDSLRTTDGYFAHFNAFERFGQTPLASGALFLVEAMRRLTGSVVKVTKEPLLQDAILRRLSDACQANGASLILMLLPEQSVTFPSPWRRYLPDHYAETVALLRAEGYVLLDGRAMLRASGLSPTDLYGPDGVHFSPDGNRVLGMAIRAKLEHETVLR